MAASPTPPRHTAMDLTNVHLLVLESYLQQMKRINQNHSHPHSSCQPLPPSLILPATPTLTHLASHSHPHSSCQPLPPSLILPATPTLAHLASHSHPRSSCQPLPPSLILPATPTLAHLASHSHPHSSCQPLPPPLILPATPTTSTPIPYLSTVSSGDASSKPPAAYK